MASLAPRADVPESCARLAGALGWLILSLAFVSLGTLSGAYDAYTALLLLALALATPVLVFVAIQTLSWREPYASTVCVILIMLLSAVFRIRAIDEKSVDFQIVIKLAGLGLTSCMAVTALLDRRASSHTIIGLLHYIPLLLFMLLECLNSVNPSVAFVEAFSNIATLFFLVAIAGRLGPPALLRILLQGGLWLCLISILVYFVDPQLGRMIDWGGNAYVTTNRLQGIFGTPNSAGASAAFCLLVILFFDVDRPWRPGFLVKAVPFAFVLWTSNNRMALLVFSCILMVAILRRHAERLALAIGVCAAALTVLIYLQFGDALLAYLSRTGSLDEIIGGNGRIQIWSVVIDLWSQRPLFGYGVGSAKFILPHHPLLFGAAAHAHSLFLNVLFSGGIIGAIFLSISFVTAAVAAWARQSDRMLLLIAFFLLYGLTEPLIGGFVSFIPIVFFSTFLLCRYSNSLSLTTIAHMSKTNQVSKSVSPY